MYATEDRFPQPLFLQGSQSAMFRMENLALVHGLRRCLPLLLALSIRALGQNWTQPTPEELQMTSDPAAPGAEVICLAMYVKDDYDKTMTHVLYVRLKILNEKGREYADVEILCRHLQGQERRGAYDSRRWLGRALHRKTI